ncbi:hypothetical protein NTE_02902 [Candidatus Nitrososphaera evergladensis SR1]|uniref:Uncharacterized protein n=1 Tax=Candidatus Nitrososphaera evergladensis SR1 TaxID=1459636 RepID=A0A075MUQ5_9ARCH|nr:hypothetical protein NTE_02902 [Candidatus Nitrososphaera evergladensis SR1]
MLQKFCIIICKIQELSRYKLANSIFIATCIIRENL